MSGAELKQMPMGEYLALPGYSRSMLDDLRRSPAYFHGRHITGEYPNEASVAMDVGTAFHSLMESPFDVTPENFDKLGVFIPIPADVLSSNGARMGKAWKEFEAANPGKVLLKADEYAPLPKMIASVLRRKRAAALLAAKQGINAVVEGVITWTDQLSGLPCKARTDLMVEDTGLQWVVDFKTCRSAELSEFANSCERYGYHRQHAWYADGTRELIGDVPIAVIFVIVEKEPPYTCRLVELEPDWVERGRRENRAMLSDLAERLETGDWDVPGGGDVVQIEEPRWARWADSYSYTGE